MERKNFVAALTLLCVSLIAVLFITKRGVPVVLQTNLENIPMQLGNYQGKEDYFSQAVYDELNADRHVFRHYRNPQGNEIDLYIGYYGTAKGGRTGHNPYGCLPGAGWGILYDEKMTFLPSYAQQGVRINYVISQKGGMYNLIAHWYQSDGTHVLATGWQQNLQRFNGKILNNRNDGAFVRISVVTDEENIKVSKEKLVEFTLEVLELLPHYWPTEGIL